MITFDDLIKYAKLVFDDLDSGFLDAYEQQGAPALTLSADGGQEIVEIIEQGLDVDVLVSADGAQEWVAGSWTAVAYLQQGRAAAFFFPFSGQEYIPVFGGISGQTGDATLNLYPSSAQSYFAGALSGEILQQGEASIHFAPDGVQAWYPQSIQITAYVTLNEIAPYGSEAPTVAPAEFNDTLGSVSQVRLTFDSTDPDWLTGVGAFGGAMAVEVAVKLGSAYVPLVSLSKGAPVAVFYEGDRFDALREAILADDLELRLGGFEAMTDYVAPRSLIGTNVLGVEAIN